MVPGAAPVEVPAGGEGGVGYPPPPWHLRGPCVLVAMPVPLAAAAARLPGGLTAVAVAPGWSLGGLLLASYGEGSTMHYDELIVFSALARRGRRLGFWVSHIVVDLPASVAGGRAVWGLPKELAQFAWDEDAVEVTQGAERLVRVRLPRAGRPLSLPLIAPLWSVRDGHLAHVAARGGLRAAPGRSEVEIPPAGPLTDLAFGPVLASLTGHVDLPFPAPSPAG